jgi:hypothetical protein
MPAAILYAMAQCCQTLTTPKPACINQRVMSVGKAQNVERRQVIFSSAIV